jgi:predicted MFS family arabinose efflux permease
MQCVSYAQYLIKGKHTKHLGPYPVSVITPCVLHSIHLLFFFCPSSVLLIIVLIPSSYALSMAPHTWHSWAMETENSTTSLPLDTSTQTDHSNRHETAHMTTDL